MTVIQPFGDRILVKVSTPEERTKSGLLVTPVSKKLSNRGIVVAVGEGTLLDDGTVKPLNIKVGDDVIFQLGTGTDFMTETESYKILHVRDVLGKFTEKGE